MAFNNRPTTTNKKYTGKPAAKAGFNKGGASRGKPAAATGNYANIGAVWNDDQFGPSVSVSVHKDSEYKGKKQKARGRLLFEDYKTGKVYTVKYMKARYSDAFNEAMADAGVDINGTFDRIPLLNMSINLDNASAVEEIELGADTTTAEATETDDDADDTEVDADDEEYEA